jgi:hypothetical protein
LKWFPCLVSFHSCIFLFFMYMMKIIVRDCWLCTYLLLLFQSEISFCILTVIRSVSFICAVISWFSIFSSIRTSINLYQVILSNWFFLPCLFYAAVCISHCIVLSGRMRGMMNGLIEVPSQYFPEVTEENHETPRQDSQCLVKIWTKYLPNYKSRALSLYQPAW